MMLGFRTGRDLMCTLRSRRMLATAVSVLVIVLLGFYMSVAIASAIYWPRFKGIPEMAVQRESRHGAAFHHRKILMHDMTTGNSSGPAPDMSSVTPQRVGDGCTKDDIVIHQGATGPMPNGIPTYTVQVLNVCSEKAGGCELGDIHFTCGWFSTARLINPRIFRRLRYDDCLVNDGRALPSGSSLSFQYANSFPYQLSISSASCISTSH